MNEGDIVKRDFEYILFDLDGTLTDPGIGITNSVMYALKKFGIEVSDRSELYKFIGPPLKYSFAEYYGFNPENVAKAEAYYRDYFKDTGIYENEIYEGIKDVLSTLKNSGKKIYLATSKPEEFANRILEYFEIAEYFDFISAATMDGSRSKKVDIVKYAVENINTSDTSIIVMIGDRLYDIEGAKETNINSIGVTYGYGGREELVKAGADYIVDEPLELLNILI